MDVVFERDMVFLFHMVYFIYDCLLSRLSLDVFAYLMLADWCFCLYIA